MITNNNQCKQDVIGYIHGNLLKFLTINSERHILDAKEAFIVLAPKVYERLKGSLVPGQVYRREDLAVLSSNVDRHLNQLVQQGALRKLAQGMYAAPKTTDFGEAMPEEASLLRTFLKDDHFVIYSLNDFNSLELGTTQLYNQRIVFNRKRIGEYTLGGRTYTFYRWREAPKSVTAEFLVVELLGRLDQLAEDREQILMNLKQRISRFNTRKLLYSAAHYAKRSTQKRLVALLSAGMIPAAVGGAT